MTDRHRLRLFVQLPVPPPAPPLPPPAEPVPPPAPEPLAPPALPDEEPVAPPSPALPPEGAEGVLSGGITGPLVAPDLVPVASVLSPDSAKAFKDAADNKPASNNEVILMFNMARLQKSESLPDVGVRGGGVGAGWVTSGIYCGNPKSLWERAGSPPQWFGVSAERYQTAWIPAPAAPAAIPHQ